MLLSVALRRLAAGLDVAAALAEVEANANLWGGRPERTGFPGSPHGDVLDIWLRWNAPGETDHRECASLPELARLPVCRAWIWNTAHAYGASRIGRAFLSKLPPGGRILPHRDVGVGSLYYDTETYYSRVHLVLQGDPGSRFYCGEEWTEMRTGELWTFDGAQVHSVENRSPRDRIHLFFDLRL